MISTNDSFGMKTETLYVRSRPFKHMYVQDVFDAPTYQRISAAFLKKRDDGSYTSRIRSYGALIKALNHTDEVGFHPFLDPKWLCLIGEMLGLDTTLEVDAAIHSHAPGSQSGWIHNDFNPGWFSRTAEPASVLLSSSSTCQYKSGVCSGDFDMTKIQRMRYLTMIYYLCNDWRPGCGGDTGLYDSALCGLTDTASKAPPINNSLLVFECSPHSWHSFLQTKIERNSITLWLHRTLESAKSQWPFHEPVYWS